MGSLETADKSISPGTGKKRLFTAAYRLLKRYQSASKTIRGNLSIRIDLT